MATISNTTLLSNNSSAANFRAWAVFYRDTFALGWTDTAATGQIDLTTVGAPGANNTSMGFKVYRMADTLQSTAPIFVKIEFGSGASITTPAVWLTIGTTHDGAGTIGNVGLARLQMQGVDGGATVQANNYGSAATNRITIAPFLTTSQASMWFAIERTMDSTGADTNVGYLCTLGYASQGINRSYYVPFAGTIPAFQFGLHIILTHTTPSTLNGNVGISAVIPMGYDAKQPGMNHLVCLVNDFANFADIPVTVYGSSRNYKHCGAQINTLRAYQAGVTSGTDTNTRLLMRYE